MKKRGSYENERKEEIMTEKKNFMRMKKKEKGMLSEKTSGSCDLKNEKKIFLRRKMSD